MEQNKTRTYLLYALGEVLLVVIGILLAVQINQMVNDAENERRRVELVSQLNREFQGNLDQLDSMMFYQNEVIRSGNTLMEIIRNREGEIARKYFMEQLIDNSWTWTYDPRDGVLKSSISSGHIHLLKNDTLKTLLFSWESMVLDGREEQLRSITHYWERFIPFLENYIMIADLLEFYEYEVPPSNHTSRIKALLDDPQFENMLVTRTVNIEDVYGELYPLYETNEKILKMLKEE